jgi:hypothetical protein
MRSFQERDDSRAMVAHRSHLDAVRIIPTPPISKPSFSPSPPSSPAHTDEVHNSFPLKSSLSLRGPFRDAAWLGLGVMEAADRRRVPV